MFADDADGYLTMRNNAFSLVELSIVLVILGLLTGGILTGQSLIRAAELRSATTEMSKYLTVVHTFRDKYFALPGDMSNATKFWGSMTNCGAANPSGSGTQTCDGTGNGTLSGAAAAGQTAEVFTFWQHLANAGLIEGTYTGITGPSGTVNAVIGTNVPASKLPTAGWTASTYNPASDPNNFAYNYGNSLTLGANNGALDTSGKILTPEEAWNIDTKIDDGRPGTGSVIGIHITTCTTAANNTDFNAPYRLNSTSKECAFRLRNVF